MTPHPRFLRELRSYEDDPKFGTPAAMVAHPHLDLVFAAEYNSHRMQIFRSDGTRVKQWGSWGTGDGEFNAPCDVAVLANRGHPTRDRIFVADYQNHRIQVFGLDGTFIRKWGSKGQDPGQFDLASGVAVLARSRDGGPGPRPGVRHRPV